MTALDWILVAIAVLAAASGARRGFVAGLLSLAGFLGGAFAGARLAPLLLDGGSASPWAPMFGLAGALMLGLALSGLLGGIGRVAVDAVPLPGLGSADAVLGALLGAAVALAVAWIAAAAALQTPGARTLRDEVRASVILRELNDVLPPSGPLLRALARFDPLPSIAGPSPGSIAAPTGDALGRQGTRAAAGGTVRVLGEACGLGVTGSGWIAADDIVVTNAHVVAGTDGEVDVQVRGAGERYAARAIHYDPRNDVAVLKVMGLPGKTLTMAGDPASGTAGAILGYPLNGPFDARAARIGTTRRVLAEDVYGRGPVARRMTAIRGTIRPGNSGGPVVDGDGRVLTTVFASSDSEAVRGGYGVPNTIIEDALTDAGSQMRSVSTGECAG